MNIAVVTDSTSDLDSQYVAQSGVRVVPSTILFNLHTHLDDGLSLPVPQLLQDMLASKGTVSTQPPSVESYTQAYHDALEQAEHVISLHTSELIAQNIVQARTAAQPFGHLVTVLDSLTTTGGQGLQVKRLVEGIQRGLPLQTLVEQQRKAALEGLLTFVVDDLRFLRMNGRIGAATALIGSMLNVKPLLSIRQGQIESVGRSIGHRRAVHTLAETVRDYQRSRGNIRLALLYTPGGEQTVAEVRGLLTGVPFEDMGNWAIGAAVAANAGPGAVGVALEPALS